MSIEDREATLRRAIDGVTLEQHLAAVFTAKRRAQLQAAKPHLFNLAGGACFVPVVWPSVMPLLGIALFTASSLIGIRRAFR